MFIDTQIFKKLIKEAYKGQGLVIGHDREGFFFEGGYWILWVKEGLLPKKEKAAVIELSGELPEAGEVFKAIDKLGNQMEIERKDAWDVRRWIKDATEEVHPTMVLFMQKGTLCRLLQTESREVVVFNEMLFQAVNNKFIDKEMETPAKGPYKTPENNTLMLWKNESCIYAALKRRKPEAGKELEILHHLEGISLIEDSTQK